MRGFTSQKTKARGRGALSWGPGESRRGAFRYPLSGPQPGQAGLTGLPAPPPLASPLPGPGHLWGHRLCHHLHLVSPLTSSYTCTPHWGPPFCPPSSFEVSSSLLSSLPTPAPACWAHPDISPLCPLLPTPGPTPITDEVGEGHGSVPHSLAQRWPHTLGHRVECPEHSSLPVTSTSA